MQLFSRKSQILAICASQFSSNFIIALYVLCSQKCRLNYQIIFKDENKNENKQDFFKLMLPYFILQNWDYLLVQNILCIRIVLELFWDFRMPTIKLQSSDGEVFPVDVDIARQSVTIRTMLEDLGMEEEEDEVVPLPNVNAAILKKVIQWATYHKDDPPPPEDDENKEKRTDDISSWDSDFLKVDQGTLFELILAANYLDIKVTF